MKTIATKSRSPLHDAITAPPRTRHAKLWTQRGLRRLGAMIRQAREQNGWSMDQLVVLIQTHVGEKIAKRTISNVENSTGWPTYNTIASIAALRFVKDPRTQKPLTEYDFIDLASENYPLEMSTIPELIDFSCIANKVSEGEVSRKLQEMRERGLASLGDRELEEIRRGTKSPTDDEIRVLRELFDPNGEAFHESEWLKAASIAL